MEYLILIVFGIFAGITSSLFGFGGGFIVVPLIFRLVAGSKYSMQVAIATSVCIMVVNCLSSIYRHSKKGNILWEYVFPIIYYVSVGALLGAIIASKLSGTVVRVLFIAYMAYVIYNCLFKKHFINQLKETTMLTKTQSALSGTVIGIIAAALGVGGSILTVPLMRKMGLTMKHAVALANPLSLPVAIVGSLTYAMAGIMAHVHLGKLYVGFIYLPAVLIFGVCGFIGVPIGAKLAGVIPDKIHAKVYVLLLFLTLTAMIIE